MGKLLMKIAAGLLLLTTVAGCCHCRALQKNSAPLIGTEWQLIQLGNQSMTPSAETYTLTFGEDKRLTGMGACNRLSGGYSAGEKNTLQITPLASTRMACPGMEIESDFMQAIQSATRYDIDGSMLLLMEGETLRAVFHAKMK